MKISSNILAGAAGALVLNVIHELVRKNVKDAPQVNKLGEEGVIKISKALGGKPPKGEKLYTAALGGDLIGNAFYYSAVGKGSSKYIWWRGLGLGITAGIGALTLPKKLGLNDKPVNGSTKTKALTVLWYTVGGLAAAGAAKLLQEQEGDPRPKQASSAELE
ncbi:hypothetical protein [Sphingobacterium griseoflavum]|uniref:Uncharacterized protein n=1 Tax=Sphingobacterium griseoflavum TaxID=1474952 RepID=A0ABQ3HXC4_9SPHI|nr:hypothetical protein [Sphingobacterium griseoflavum]GHE35365.1 hypothetical protein GCM10017764_18300 [Sphingobacterium griseoflavum]